MLNALARESFRSLDATLTILRLAHRRPDVVRDWSRHSETTRSEAGRNPGTRAESWCCRFV